jgi:hypothetical protein
MLGSINLHARTRITLGSTLFGLPAPLNAIVLCLNPSIATGHFGVDNADGPLRPAALRRLFGIDCGPPLMLAVAVPEQVIVVHAAATSRTCRPGSASTCSRPTPPGLERITPPASTGPA